MLRKMRENKKRASGPFQDGGGVRKARNEDSNDWKRPIAASQ